MESGVKFEEMFRHLLLVRVGAEVVVSHSPVINIHWRGRARQGLPLILRHGLHLPSIFCASGGQIGCLGHSMSFLSKL